MLYGPSWNPVFYGSPRILPGEVGRPKKDYKGLTAPLPFSQLHSVLMRFAQIVRDLFEVFTKKPQNPLDLV